MKCEICCEPRKLQPCTACAYAFCKPCAKRVSERDASCPSCRHPWEEADCQRHLGRTYHTKVQRPRVRQRLLLREMSRLTEAQPYARRERQRRFLREEIRRLHVETRDHGRWELLQDVRVAQRTLQLLNTSTVDTPENSSHPLMRCPWEGCRGVVSGDERCNMCERRTCVRCGNPAHPGTGCSQDDLSSITVIRQMTRPCVSCGIPSARVEGCPVMWCPQCHVFWHWEHRRIIETRNHVPHNPDHRDWLAEHQGQRMREVQDLPCGGFPDANLLHNAILRGNVDRNVPYSIMYAGAPQLLTMMETLLVAQTDLRLRYPRTVNDEPLLQLRVEFLLGDFSSEDAYSKAIERHERNKVKKQELGFLLETFVLSGLDLIQRFVHEVDTMQQTLVCFNELCLIFNAASASVSRTWDWKTPIITGDWKWKLPYQRR